MQGEQGLRPTTIKQCEVCRGFFKTKNPKMKACSECYPHQNVNNYLEKLLEKISHGNERILERITFRNSNHSK